MVRKRGWTKTRNCDNAITTIRILTKPLTAATALEPPGEWLRPPSAEPSRPAQPDPAVVHGVSSSSMSEDEMSTVSSGNEEAVLKKRSLEELASGSFRMKTSSSGKQLPSKKKQKPLYFYNVKETAEESDGD